MKAYINTKMAYDTIYPLLVQERDNFGDVEYKEFINGYFDDEYIDSYAYEIVKALNQQMGEYLNLRDHRIEGNLCNIRHDYPGNLSEMVTRLNNGDESPQSDSDRIFLTDWMFEAFGTYNIKYKFGEIMSEVLYWYEKDLAEDLA